jgi:predicted outer membrane protein
VSTSVGDPVRPRVDAKHRAMIAKLRRLSGSAFDTAYMSGMVADHTQAVAGLDGERQVLEQRSVRPADRDTFEVDQDHNRRLRACPRCTGRPEIA